MAAGYTHKLNQSDIGGGFFVFLVKLEFEK